MIITLQKCKFNINNKKGEEMKEIRIITLIGLCLLSVMAYSQDNNNDLKKNS